MEIEGGIDPDTPLDYIELQIFPSQNRYDAYVCWTNRVKIAASGTLKQLLLHSPRVKDLCSKSLNTNFKILPPDNINDAEWFTTATLRRFLQIIGLPDILTIGNEITQLEETRKFQLSLSVKAEVGITSSIESKNDLLRAVDLRLTALKDELVSVFDQATGSRCSTKDISDLENFAHHFGAKDIRDSLQKFVEMSLFPTVEDCKKSIKYGVSPAKVAQIEQHNSTDDENSSVSSERNQASVDRCRAPTRSSTPRRSASPMRRIQIGRSGSHRAPALTIKSLNYFPPREKISFQRDPAANSSDDDNDDSDKPVKKNVLRMSVQDKISLFESKQRDQKMDVTITKKLLNTTVGPNKTVLRRWSSGMGENATQNPDTKPETSQISPENVAPEPGHESDCFIFENRVSNENSENIKPHSPEREERCEKHPDSIEWSQQKEAELNELFMKMMENKNKNKPVRDRNPSSDNTKNKKSLVLKEEKEDEKLRVKASGKKATTKPQNEKTQKNSTPLMNSRNEALKPSVLKKITSKPSSLPATRKSWPSLASPTSANNTPTSRKPQSTSLVVRSTTKSEKTQPWSKTLKSTPPGANRNFKNINEKKQPTVTKSIKTTKPKVQTTEVKPSFNNKVTKKSSVVPLETRPFLRKGSGIGPGAGPVVIKSKVVDQPEEISRTSGALIQTEDNEVVMTTDIIENQEKSAELMSCNLEVSEIKNENNEELMISPTAWVEEAEDESDNDNEEEIIPCLVQTVSPVKAVVPTGSSSSPRIRHSLSQMLLEESSEEADISEWGNAEHPPLLLYQKDSPKGFKRLLKFARKNKAESAVLEGDDDAEETKATRSFFSLSAFRGSKTNESKLS